MKKYKSVSVNQFRNKNKYLKEQNSQNSERGSIQKISLTEVEQLEFLFLRCRNQWSRSAELRFINPRFIQIAVSECQDGEQREQESLQLIDEEPGDIEAELARMDAKTIVKKFMTFRESGPIYFPKGKGFHHSPDDAIVSLPSWLSEDDVEYFASKLEKAGISGGVNYYRVLRLNWELSASWSGAKVTVPTKFITGDEDLVYHMPGVKDYIEGDGFRKDVPFLEEVVVIKGAAHFINQEKPDEINKHILEFIRKF
ncbi:hypothetical protein SSX86_004413 [Deinandra increscens subsp. villosa]|uniref:Epoxide hydrolase n=1 Tax=Deinandra increscens subsp. villosa TaxID=3103831 RepID=A0AAP0HAW6_9ASTR